MFTETEPLEPEEPTGPAVITEQPEGDLYILHRNSGYILFSDNVYCGKTEGDVNVVINEQEGKAYIKNPLWWMDYDYWVEGEYDSESGLIAVPTGQYVYYNLDAQYGIQLMWGSTTVTEGFSGYMIDYAIDESVADINFIFTGDALYLLDSDGNVNADFPEWGFATGMAAMYDDYKSLICLEFTNKDSYGEELPFAQYIDLVPAVPADPEIVDWFDGGDEEGNTFLLFTLPTTDVDGNLINPEYLSYSIWLDNGGEPELFTFEADTYNEELWEDMTEIPYWLYTYAWNITAEGCVFYRTNEGDNPLFTQNIGVQVFYEVDGEKNASNIVWLFEQQVGVDELSAGKEIASVRYYNLTGQEMAQPQGVTIRFITYSDGTVSATKGVN